MHLALRGVHSRLGMHSALSGVHSRHKQCTGSTFSYVVQAPCPCCASEIWCKGELSLLQFQKPSWK